MAVKTLKLYGPFLWTGFNCLKTTHPLRGYTLLFTFPFPRVPGTHLTDLRRMKGWVSLEATQRYWTQNPLIGNPWESSALTTRPVQQNLKNFSAYDSLICRSKVPLNLWAAYLPIKLAKRAVLFVLNQNLFIGKLFLKSV